jgi:hypothetical protein
LALPLHDARTTITFDETAYSNHQKRTTAAPLKPELEDPMTPTQAAAAIRNSAGRFFTCVFVKADGSRREIDPP